MPSKNKKRKLWDIGPKGGRGYWQNPKFLSITNLGHYYIGGGFQKFMSQNLIWDLAFFSPLIFEVFLPKPLILLFLQREQSTMETAHINFMIKRGVYSRICVSWFYNQTFWKLKKLPKAQKNPPNMSQMQVGGRGSSVKPTCPDFGCPK